jgi:molecular chaperone Hsp33
MNKDLLHRFIFDNIPVRGEYIYLHDSFQTIVHQHNYPPPIRQLLGEALCAAALLSAIIKFKGRLTVQFRSKGNLKLLLAQCNNNFHLRGLVKWDGDLSYADLMAAFHEGTLVIMLDSGPGKQNYQGIVPWNGNSLAEAIEGYFRNSEQLATRIWLTVDERAAAGLLLQMVPDKNKASNIEQEIVYPGWEYIAKLATTLQLDDLLYVDYRQVLLNLYPEEEIRIFSPIPVMFRCTCSRKRGKDAVLLLGQQEAEAELKDKNSIVVTCEFCNKQYIFDRVDVAKIFRDSKRPSKNIDLHQGETKH